MALYLDRHDGLVLPAAAVQQSVADIKAKKRYPDGVMLVNGYASPQGTFFCLTDAPNAEAVREHHKAEGIPCGEVVEINPLV